MSTDRKWNEGAKPMLLIVLVCVTLSVISSAIPAVASLIPTSTETLVMGGSDCSEFMDGAAVGLGIGVLFGCVWCGAGAVVAKGIALFC
jgi:hypothetical protein